jgi:hypothetical protein
VFRINPVARFNGRTFGGIGVTNSRGFITTGVQGSQRTIFNSPRAQASPGMKPLPGMRPSYHSTVPYGGNSTGGHPRREIVHGTKRWRKVVLGRRQQELGAILRGDFSRRGVTE